MGTVATPCDDSTDGRARTARGKLYGRRDVYGRPGRLLDRIFGEAPETGTDTDPLGNKGRRTAPNGASVLRTALTRMGVGLNDVGV